MTRLSSYVVQIPLKDTNKTMLIHGYTGAIDVISNQTLEQITQSKHDLSGKISISNQTICKLKRRGYFTNLTREEEIAYVTKIAKLLHQRALIGKKSFGFLITYNCNFRCPYCYESKISNFGNGWSKKTFDTKLVDEAYAAMTAIEPNSRLHNKNLLLYGGEPLLKINHEVVKYIVEKGKSLGYTFSTITNGYDLAYYSDLLAPDKIASIQVTIDGVRNTHNKNRVHESGKGSFDVILHNIGIALNKGTHVNVRMNCNDANISEIADLHAIFQAQGFISNPNFNFYSALIYDYLGEIKNKDSHAKEQQFMNRDRFINISNQYPNHHFQDEGVFTKIKRAIESGKRIFLSPTYCAAFVGSYLFDPYRNIYSCWESLGNTRTIVGKYHNGEVTFNENLSNMHTYDVTKKTHCTKCKYVFLCRGGCPQKKEEKICEMIPQIFKTSANKAYRATCFPNKSIV